MSKREQCPKKEGVVNQTNQTLIDPDGLFENVLDLLWEGKTPEVQREVDKALCELEELKAKLDNDLFSIKRTYWLLLMNKMMREMGPLLESDGRPIDDFTT